MHLHSLRRCWLLTTELQSVCPIAYCHPRSRVIMHLVASVRPVCAVAFECRDIKTSFLVHRPIQLNILVKYFSIKVISQVIGTKLNTGELHGTVVNPCPQPSIFVSTLW